MSRYMPGDRVAIVRSTERHPRPKPNATVIKTIARGRWVDVRLDRGGMTRRVHHSIPI